jgi:predicted AlkP superfamily pyrophosphatase or phosphodiesterase
MRLFLLLLSAFILSACATRRSVSEEYREQQASHHSDRTTIYFLVDGLGMQTLKRGLVEKNIANIQKYFLPDDSKIPRAHSVFPSLTFPNISSLLLEKPLNQSGALGNSIIYKGQLISFESVLDRPLYSDFMRGDNVFTRLRQKGMTTASLDYGLGVDATVSSDIVDLKTGLALERQDYLYMDKKRIDSLRLLLEQNQTSQWPEFIFIHLVGVDFLSHQYGPQSEKVQEYLKLLDEQLGPVLAILKRTEIRSDHKIISMLSADHGFNPVTPHVVEIEEIVSKVEPQLKVLNEGRVAALYASREPSLEQANQWSSELLKFNGLEIVSYRIGNRVFIRTRSQLIYFDYVSSMECPHQSMGISVMGASATCPQNLKQADANRIYPYFTENLASYFQAPKHPDLIITPDRFTGFLKSEAGFHGGPTLEETEVPLLMRNVTLKDPSFIPAQWQILEFL